MASSMEDSSLGILELEDLDNEEDEETWLVAPPDAEQNNISTWKKWNMSEDPEVRMKKRSLVEKLDFIAKSSPTRNFITRPSMSSTPMTKPVKQFDPRTFTRPSPSRNLTFDKDTTDLLANLSIDKDEQDWKNQTFTRKRLSRDSSEGFEDDRGSVNSENSSGHHRLNDVDDVMTLARLQEESLRETLGLNSTFSKGLNSTFNKGGTPPIKAGLNSTYQKLSPPPNATITNSPNLTQNCHNATFDVNSSPNNATFDISPGAVVKGSRSSSQDNDLEDRLSSTSDSSMSHRLNDLGDVQNLARMQEESLRQVVITNNHRSATVSPSSENSPSQDMQSEEGSYANHGGGFNQYSSQDSLPDSPYSSQSLDSQPAPGQDRIGRSMPNLNKIRGQNKANVGLPQGSQLSHGRGHPTVAYGLSRQHTSDPRMQPPRSSAYPPPGAPARGAVMSRDVSFFFFDICIHDS